MEMPGLHSIKHLMAEKIRNHIDNILDVGPMGCQTGFYLAILNNDEYEQVCNALARTLEDVLIAMRCNVDGRQVTASQAQKKLLKRC